ncbi:Hypothetical predicted protein, partial [Mytilus galloprovincialis]
MVALVAFKSTVNAVNNNGCTCLHYASAGGLSEVIVAAVQYGFDIEKRDKKGQSMLEIAVAKKNVTLIELLCSFGSSVTIDDWALVGVDVDILNQTDQHIMRTLIKQIEREAENTYGNNAFEVCYVNPGEDISMCSDITLNMDNIRNGFFLYCSRVIAEYTDYTIYRGSEDELFSDVYEIKTWGDIPRYLDLHIYVLGIVQNNQVVNILPLEGFVKGNITCQALSSGDYREEYTTFDIKVDLRRMKTAKFVILSQLRQEKFDVTTKAIKIIPQSESSAEINIPEGAFKSTGKLMLNVADTNDWNGEETVLFSSALDLTMQNNVQPSKPVNMKLPLHSLTVSADDLIIIASHKDIPETEKDWEICSTNINIEGNTVSFAAEHFTRFAVGSKNTFKKSAESATLAVLRYRPAEIFAGLKKEADDKLTLIVEIALKHYGKKRRKYWKQNGFRLQSTEYKDGIVKDGETLE